MSGKRFSQVLAEIRGGLVETELSAQLNELVERVQESGKEGTITFQLKLSPHGRSNREIHVSTKINTKMPPKPDMEEPSIFFAVRGDLVRHDPDQANLFGPRSVEPKADGSSFAEQRITN